MKKKLCFVIVNGCTSLNMFLGVAAIFLAPLNPMWAAWCLVASVIFDACDGYLARKWGVSSEFGAQLDSLGDFCSFSLGTGAMSYYWIAGQVPLAWCLVAVATYILCGAIRLARYNANTDSLCPPEYFQGLPTTAAACSLATLCILGRCEQPLVPCLLTLVYGLLMVSSLPYPKLTRMTWMPKWVWFTPLAVAAFSPMVSAWLFVGVYAVSGPIVWIKRWLSAPKGDA